MLPLLVYSSIGVAVNGLDWDIVVCVFKPQPCYYVHFQINKINGKFLIPLLWQRHPSRKSILTLFSLLLVLIRGFIPFLSNPVGWGYMIRQLHLCRRWEPHHQRVTDMALNHLMVTPQIPDLRRMWSNSSILLLPGPLWPGVGIAVGVSLPRQIEQINNFLFWKLLTCVTTNDSY